MKNVLLFLLLPCLGFSQIPILLNMDLPEEVAREKLQEYDFMDDFYNMKETHADSFTVFSINAESEPSLWVSIDYVYQNGSLFSCTEVVPVSFLGAYRDFHAMGSKLTKFEKGSKSYYVYEYTKHVVTIILDLSDKVFSVEYHKK